MHREMESLKVQTIYIIRIIMETRLQNRWIFKKLNEYLNGKPPGVIYSEKFNMRIFILNTKFLTSSEKSNA